MDAISNYLANNSSTRLVGETSHKDSAPDRSTGLGKYLDTLSTNTDTVAIKAADAATSNLPTAEASDSNTITINIDKKCKGNEELQAAGVRSHAVINLVENASERAHHCSNAS